MSNLSKVDEQRVKLEITVDAETFEGAVQQSYHKNVKSINVPGFRRGKAPRKIIEMQYGPSVFYEDAFELVFPDAYEAAVKEHELEVVDRPDVDVESIGKEGVTFTATVTLKPEVTLGEYKGIEVVRREIAVSDEQVENELKAAQERMARWVIVEDRPVQNGDRIVLDYAGSVDGVAFDGGTAEDQNLEIGSNSFIPGFEEQVVGVKSGEEADLHVTFPEDYHEASLKGANAVFHIKVKEIKEKELPELDDELAKDVSEFDTLDEFRAGTRERLEKSAVDMAENRMENEMVQTIVENASVEIPDCMVEQEIDDMVQQFAYRLMYQGLRLEQYLEYTGMDMPAFRKQYTEEAKTRVKTRLVVEKLVVVENIEVDEAEIDAEYEEFAKQYQRDPAAFKAEATDEQKDMVKRQAKIMKLLRLLKESRVLIEAPAEVENVGVEAAEGEVVDVETIEEKAPQA